jgi:hypothetical protein
MSWDGRKVVEPDRSMSLLVGILADRDLELAQAFDVAPNGLAFSCRERTAETVKMRTISRAKRSATTACSAATPFLLA